MTKKPPEKPEGLTDSHLLFLDCVRDSGVTNMFGAAPYLEEHMGVERRLSRRYLQYWMETFSTRSQKLKK